MHKVPYLGMLSANKSNIEVSEQLLLQGGGAILYAPTGHGHRDKSLAFKYDEAKQLFDAFSTDTRKPLEFVDTKAEEGANIRQCGGVTRHPGVPYWSFFPVDILLIREKTCATESH